MSNCIITPLENADRVCAIEMIASVFTSDDPLATSQGIRYSDFHSLIDSLYDEFLACGLSYAAYDPSNGSVAALLLSDRNLQFSSNEGSDAIANIISVARKQYFKKHSPVSSDALHIHFIASSPDYRRQKLVSKLVTSCLDNASQRGIGLAVVEASGIRSRALLRDHHGFSERVSIDYSSFEWRNTLPFASIVQHGGLTLMDKKLQRPNTNPPPPT